MILNAPTSSTPSLTQTPTAANAASTQPETGRRPSNILGVPVVGSETVGEGQTKPAAGKKHNKATNAQQTTEVEAGQRSGWITWLMVFTSFLGLQLNQTLGAVAIVIFLAPWMLLILTRLPQMVKATMRDHLLVYMPLLTGLSAIWSPDPMATLRLAVQFSVTVAIGIAAAHLMPRRLVITSWVSALTLMTVAGLAVSVRQYGLAGLHGAIGLYGSKNVFASSAAIQFIGAAYLLVYSRDSLLNRMIGLAFMIIALVGIYSGHSAGSMVALAATLILSIGLQLIRISGAASVLSLTLGLFTGLTLLVLVGSDVIFSGALHLLGKESTLTGRTEIWSAGFKEIGERPLFGIGYQAFWRIGYQPAERLWAMFGIENKSGFNFHNEYINTTVGLGLVGLMLAIYVLVKVGLSSVIMRLREGERLESALHSMFFFFFFLTFAEQEFFYQFNISTIVLSLVWADHYRGRAIEASRHVPRPASVLSP